LPACFAFSITAKVSSFWPRQQVPYPHEERMQALDTRTMKRELQCPG